MVNVSMKVESVNEVKDFVKNQFNTFWDAYKIFSNPKVYKVDLSDRLWTLKSELVRFKEKHIIMLILIKGAYANGYNRL